jgi:Mrp family chromosome partitioning ATPase
MSISDQAFIRAYHKDPSHADRGSIAAVDVGLGSVIPPPHAKFPPMNAPGTPDAQNKTSHSTSAANTSGSQPVPAEQQPTVALNSLTAANIGMNRPHIPLGQSPKATLSSLTGVTALTTATAEKPKLAMEIDAVRWPAVCQSLLVKSSDGFDRLAADLRAESATGRKITAITGTDRGEGRTTLALCLARQLAAANAKIALVDADFSSPHMAAQLGIAIDRGWEAALAGEEAWWEVMIESVGDRFALALLGSGVSTAAASHSSAIAANASINSALTSDLHPLRFVPQAFRIAAVLSELAEHFDIVLLDAGPLAPESATAQWLLEPTVGVHNIIMAHDVRRTEAPKLAAGCLQLAEAKQHQLGIVETFVAEEAGGKLQTAGSRQ